MFPNLPLLERMIAEAMQERPHMMYTRLRRRPELNPRRIADAHGFAVS